uniref:ARAD1B11902p n=1 Tax=Blastobotrys adeninivorans TaxID=409370 RepID=A0A060TBW6_BLAAD
MLKARCWYSQCRGYHAEWPKKIKPTPYDIFNISSGDKIDKQKLKKVFIQYARTYHPDSIADRADKLSERDRMDRFKQIAVAYDILKDDKKRREWDSRHSSRPYPSSHPTAPWSAPHRSNPNWGRNHEDFYARGPEEDWSARRRQYDAKFQEELRQNRKKLTILVSAGVVLIAYFQLKLIFKVSSNYSQEMEKYSIMTQMDEWHAKQNYGMGSLQDQRIARFLMSRESGRYYNNYALHSGESYTNQSALETPSGPPPPIPPSQLPPSH